MPSFDISMLAQFEAPAARCPRCLGMWTKDQAFPPSGRIECPVCGAFFMPHGLGTGGYLSDLTITYPMTAAGIGVGLQRSPVAGNNWVTGGWTSFGGPGVAIDLGADPLDHARTLAERAIQLRSVTEQMPPLRGLMHLLLSAKSFVHITSFGLDRFMLGLLETVAQLVPVYVLASGLDPKIVPDLAAVPSEAPQLKVRVNGTKADTGDQNHGKLIVVDGILAVAGSANFTLPAWRKALDGLEIVEVITGLDRVRDLNNLYFAAHWASHSDTPSSVVQSGGWSIYPSSARLESALTPTTDEDASNSPLEL